MTTSPATEIATPQCPVCTTVQTQAPESNGTLSCSHCGHVFAGRRVESNEFFESESYLEWRASNSKFLLSEAHHRVGFFRQVTKHLVPKQVLEFGCATGEALAEFSREGSNCLGLDLSHGLIGLAKKLHPEIQFEVALDPKEGSKFDLIMAFHVLEHIEDAKSFVGKAQSRLNPGGHILLGVPNYASLTRKVFRENWPDFIPEHVQHFSPRSMRHLLEANGFEVLQIKTVGRGWQWLGGLKRAVKGGNKAAPAAKTRPSEKAILALRVFEKTMYPFLKVEEVCGVGSEMLVVARKRSS